MTATGTPPQQSEAPPLPPSPAPAATAAPAPAPGRVEALKRAVVGRPMRSDAVGDTLLRKTLALPIFASDPFSSVAYATEAALLVLVGTAATAAHLVFPLSIGVGVLLAVVIASYRQTVRAYSTSGGSYVVTRENLGRVPSLVAAAALLTDYILTVAVSVAAGVFAIVSAVPSLHAHILALSLAAVAVITLVNLRGVRESGVAFALPTYVFIAVYVAMIAIGVGKCAAGTCPQAIAPDALPAGAGAVGLFVLLKAFASGSAALTGVEAVSNGVSAFRHPQARNAARTLSILGVVSITFFVGVSWLATRMHARPSESVSVVAQIARGVFPAGSSLGFLFWVVQISTFAILVLAANTSFQGFPRLAALLARDRFFPRQFANLGDRLVFSNGILVLAGAAVLLLVAYDASVDSLIHLYVLGVFTAFTLSQAGMVRHWRRTREPGWRRGMLLNGLGATATGVVLVVVVVTKFTEGAWLVTVAIPLMVLGFLGIHRHYRRTSRRLRASAAAMTSAALPRTSTVLAVDDLGPGTERAVWLARLVAGDSFRAVHVPGPGSDTGIRARWSRAFGDAPLLQVLPRDGSRADAVLEHLWTIPRNEVDFLNVVVPETFRGASLRELIAHARELRLKLALLREPGVVVTDVPVVRGDDPLGREAVCRVLVSDVHGASLRALAFARTLGLDDVRAVFFAFDAVEATRLRSDWERRGIDIPLEVHEAPYRDLGDPLRDYLRRLTGQDKVVAVVMPELVVDGWRRLLHNQRALYVKRILLFEPHVILTSVPYRLR